MRTSPRGSDCILSAASSAASASITAARVFKDLLSDLGQVHASGRAIEEPYAEPLFQHGNPTTDARLGKPKSAGAGGEAVMLHDSREELEVIEIPHHRSRSSPLEFGLFRRSP